MKNNIHVFKDRHGRGYAADPNSGAVHEMSDTAFAVLTEIIKLREAELLFS